MAGQPTSGGPVERLLSDALGAAFAPTILQVLNESHMHSGPATESHFKVVVVSEQFEGLNLVKRHRAINGAAKEQLDAGLHALSIIALTPAQWAERSGAVPESPLCGGGSKDD
jgi:BolA protein